MWYAFWAVSLLLICVAIVVYAVYREEQQESSLVKGAGLHPDKGEKEKSLSAKKDTVNLADYRGPNKEKK